MANKNDKPDSEFAQMMGDVRRLDSDKVDLHRQKPRPTGIQTSKRQLAHNDLPLNSSARRTTENAEQWFDHGLNAKLRRRIKSGQISIDASLDLHGYHELEAKKQLVEFLQEAETRQCQFILVIHGKGFRSESDAVLRPMVQNHLLQQPNVLAFCPAQPVDGGTGSTYVYLRTSR